METLIVVGLATTLLMTIEVESGKSCNEDFISGISKNGTFASPNYPHAYPEGSFCNYRFIGEEKERVQIIFEDFKLDHPDEADFSCEAQDHVTAYVEINNFQQIIDTFCGHDIPKDVMSNGPSMIVRFNGRQSGRFVKGFKAIYRFVTDFGIDSGKQSPNGGCEFTYDSNLATNGTIHSPNYPGTYPKNTKCHYLFYGKPNEKVEIRFMYFDIEGVPPCDSLSSSDYVEISNFMTLDRKIQRHCGKLVPKAQQSDGPFFRVTFVSGDKFDATGFMAGYQFIDSTDQYSIKRISSHPNDGSSVRQTSLFLPCYIIWMKLLWKS